MQLVVNVVAVVTAGAGAVFLQESPLTAVQMVRRRCSKVDPWFSLCSTAHGSCEYIANTLTGARVRAWLDARERN